MIFRWFIIALLLACPASGHQRRTLDLPARGACVEGALRFDASHVLYSNLGGAGPDTGVPDAILFGNVFPSSGRIVDLRVRLTSHREAYGLSNSSGNGLVNGFLSVDLAGAYTADLNFEFIDREANQPKVVDGFFFTVADIDFEDQINRGTRRVAVTGFTRYVTSYDSIIKVKSTPDSAIFELPMDGGLELPDAAASLQQADHIVTLEFNRVSNFNVSISIDANSQDGHPSRRFFFSGTSKLVCDTPAACSTSLEAKCPARHTAVVPSSGPERFCVGAECGEPDVKTCCRPIDSGACTSHHKLVLRESHVIYSNLGGFGPHQASPAGILIADVFPMGARTDLLVTADGEYTPLEVSRTGVFGQSLRVSVQPGTSVSLRFSFVDRQGQEARSPELFPFTVLELFATNGVRKHISVHGALIGKLEAGSNVRALQDFEAQELALDSDVSGPQAKAHDVEPSCRRVAVSGAPSCMPLPVTLKNSSSRPMELPSEDRQSAAGLVITDDSGRGPSNFLVNATLMLVVDNSTDIPHQVSDIVFAGASNLICLPRATCSSYTCPPGFVLRERAFETSCSSETCTDADASACCEADFNDMCRSERALKIDSSKIVHSNLGGLGPDLHAPPTLLYGNVFPGLANTVDLEVSTPNGFEGGGYNGATGELGTISLPSEESSLLRFRLIRRRTGGNMTVPPFYFTVFGLGIDAVDHQVSTVEVEGSQEYRLSPHSHLTAAEIPGAVKSLESGAMNSPEAADGEVRNSMRHALALSPEQKEHAVTYVLSGQSTFDVKVAIPSSKRYSQFIFAGSSSLTCPSRALCSSYMCSAGYSRVARSHEIPCKEAVCTAADINTCCQPMEPSTCDPPFALSLQDSVAIPRSKSRSQGEQAMMLTNVFPQSGHTVDLNIEFLEGHPENLLGGQRPFGVIHVKPGTNATLRFSFVNRSTGHEASNLWPYRLSLFDFTEANESSPVVLRIPQAINFLIAQPTAMREVNHTTGRGFEFTGRQAFTHISYETEAERVKLAHPFAASTEMRRHAISAWMNGTASSFNVSLRAAEGPGSRRLYFSGSSSIECNMRAKCSSFTCPIGYKSKGARVANMVCHGPQCAESDVSTCCVRAELRGCRGQYRLAFNQQSVIYSNLGKLGPDSEGPEGILYSNVMPIGHKTVDLIVNADGHYKPVSAMNNGFLNKFGSVSMQSMEHTRLHFTFIDRETMQPVEVGPFLFSLAHVASGAKSHAGAEFDVGEAVSVKLSSHTRAETTSKRVSKVMLPESDSSLIPEHALALTEAQLRRFATFDMPALTNFSLSVRGGSLHGHTILFAGPSNLICPTRALCSTYACPAGFVPKSTSRVCASDVCSDVDLTTCCSPEIPAECLDPALLVVSEESVLLSNLGGVGPDDAGLPVLLYGNVFPHSNETVDLQVRALDNYSGQNISENGADMATGTINVESGQSVQVEFSFTNRLTGKPYMGPAFYFSVFDLNQHWNGGGMASIRMETVVNYTLSPRTHIETEDGQKFVSAHFARDGDQLSHPLMINSLQASHTVAFLLPAESSAFNMTLDAGAGWAGRTFRFGGASSLTCPRRGLCQNFVCPMGYVRRTSAHYSVCQGAKCTGSDVTRCCMRAAPSEFCARPATMELRPDSIKHSNLGGMGPDKDAPPEIKFLNVFPHLAFPLDLSVSVVTRGPSYKTDHPELNGVYGGFGSLSMLPGTSVDVVFRFTTAFATRRQGAEDPVFVDAISAFYFSVIDLDWQSTGFGTTRAKVTSNWMEKQVSRLTEVEPSDTPRMRVGAPPDHSGMHPLAISRDQMNRSVSYLLPSSAEFTMHVSIAGNAAPLTRILFGGATPLVCPRRAPCSSLVCPAGFKSRPNSESTVCAHEVCEDTDVRICCELQPSEQCSPEMRLMFKSENQLYSNLGGAGPDQNVSAALAIGDVFPESNNTIDLVISSVDEQYRALNASVNGVNGSDLVIDVQRGTTAHLVLDFLDRATGKPFNLPNPFYVTWSQFGAANQSHERQLMLSGFLESTLTNPTLVSRTGTVDTSYSLERRPHTSTVFREEVAPPPGAAGVSEVLADISVLYPAGLSSFTATLSVGGSDGSRQFHLSGPTPRVCLYGGVPTNGVQLNRYS